MNVPLPSLPDRIDRAALPGQGSRALPPGGARGRRFLLSTVRGLLSLPAAALLRLIQLYQLTLSPALPVIFGSGCGCRFSPTCSHYAAEAIGRHGAFYGSTLAAVRLLKCAPWHSGGFDPVPAPRSSPRCVRLPT